MKTKRKTKYLRVFLLLALPIFLAVLFVFNFKVNAGGVSNGLIINEIQFQEKDHTDHDYIEINNISSGLIDLGDYNLVKMTSSGTVYSIKNPIADKGTFLESKKYFLWASNSDKNFPASVSANVSTSQTIADKNAVAIIRRNDGSITDSVGWGNIDCSKVLYCEKKSFSENISDNESIGRIDGKDTDDNSQDFKMQEPTPGKENKETKEKAPDPPKVYSDQIQITELFPNPFQAKYEEYIELYNGTSQDVDLLGWKLHDASKSGQYTFAVSTILQAKKYLAIFKKDFGFALNNSGAESVTLLDPNGKEVFSVSYEGSKQNRSDNFDGNDWHWSQFLTPGEENIFNSLPFGALEIDSDVFVNVAASFSISIGDSDGDKVSVTWDFGDGHKSYLVKTQHKYVKTGKYAGNVKLSDGSEDVVKDFEIEVQDYPHPKVRIVAINANPKGADSGVESLTIENQSSKKVNLLGWSIATGWKKFINHPIKEDVIIKKNKTAEVTNEVASFTLNNTKAKIQLRYPDGKVAQEVKYKKTSEIGEGEIYRKVKGGWTWVVSEQQSTNSEQETIDNEQNTKDNSQNTINNEQGTINNRRDTIIKIQETNNEQEKNTVTSNQPASSVDGSSVISNENRRKNKILTGEDENAKIELLKNQPAVLGAETVREVDGQYFFTPKIEQKHYLVSFWEKLLVNFNAGMNQVLNYFLEII